jgi:hypothetical protein
MTNIIIVGYPKSGNTWVVRLVAELVSCPVMGFWNSSHNEIAREGQHRKSDFQCFKSHHQLHEIRNNKILFEEKIIYVVRDPRDIVISGAYYFPIESWPFVAKLFTKLPILKDLYRKRLKMFSTESYRIKQMVHAILYGSEGIHHWVRIPWNAHYKPYLEHDFFFVKYEDLLVAPEYECKRILSYLGLHRRDDQIREAIVRQSFKKKKKEFLKNNENEKAHFMRVGKRGQWKKKLSKKQKELFLEILSDDLKQFGYPIDDNI